MELRPYQHEAVEAVYAYLRTHDDNPCVVIPTGGGKTAILATICRDAVTQWGGRVLILAHVKELLEQAAEKLRLICPDVRIGVYSAGLGRRDTQQMVIVAGIQSVYKRACELDAFDLVIVDECFVAGTQVLTPSGEIPIEQIQPGMFVRNATGIGTVEAVVARPAKSLVTLEYDDGTILRCTANHPIFTDSGWRAAGSLELGSLAFGVEDVRMLRKNLSSLDQAASGREFKGPKGTAVDEAAILLNFLRKDSEQLHGLARGPQASEQVPENEGPLPLHPRWQRTTHEAATSNAHGPGANVDRRTQRDGAKLQERAIAETPEDRYCPSRSADCLGVGWPQPSIAPTQASGLPQDALSGAKRLVRRTHHEPASGSVVFNLQVSGHPSYFANGILVHNCHLIPPEGEGMYRQFLSDARKVNPHLRVIGLTATPYRLKSGLICTPEHFLNAVCYEVGVRELIRDGYLCPLVTKAGRAKADSSSLHVRGGEFIASEVEELMDQQALVEAACAEIVAATAERQGVLIFAAGVQHGQHVVQTLAEKHGIECGFVCGETPASERDELLARFRGDKAPGLFQREPLKYLCNVNVLTTGFDAPHIDCVAMLRPTLSPGLYYQMVGRGFRLHPGKHDCLVLDFGGNVLRHGPVDQVTVNKRPGGGATSPAPAKECPECQAVIAAGYTRCPQCGYRFPPPERAQHEAQASDAGILSGQVTTTQYDVQDVYYSVHVKRGAEDDAPKTLRVDYRVGWHEYKSEWICFEHSGYARQKAVAWWTRRSPDPVPDTAERAAELAESGAVASTSAITVRAVAGEPYERIVDYELGPLPEPCPLVTSYADDDLPF